MYEYIRRHRLWLGASLKFCTIDPWVLFALLVFKIPPTCFAQTVTHCPSRRVACDVSLRIAILRYNHTESITGTPHGGTSLHFGLAQSKSAMLRMSSRSLRFFLQEDAENLVGSTGWDEPFVDQNWVYKSCPIHVWWNRPRRRRGVTENSTQRNEQLSRQLLKNYAAPGTSRSGQWDDWQPVGKTFRHECEQTQLFHSFSISRS